MALPRATAAASIAGPFVAAGVLGSATGTVATILGTSVGSRVGGRAVDVGGTTVTVGGGTVAVGAAVGCSAVAVAGTTVAVAGTSVVVGVTAVEALVAVVNSATAGVTAVVNEMRVAGEAVVVTGVPPQAVTNRVATTTPKETRRAVAGDCRRELGICLPVHNQSIHDAPTEVYSAGGDAAWLRRH